MNPKKLAIALLAVAISIGAYRWRNVGAGRPGLQAYAKVLGGMTVEDVRQVMGKEEDSVDQRRTSSGEFERSWTFADARYTVVFDKAGRSIYKEMAPDHCGVTPLMEKYIDEAGK